MSNPPKQKGTRGETELLGLLESLTGRVFRRTVPTSKWDVETADDRGPTNIVRILATRPDHGKWLLSMPAADWALADPTSPTVSIRVEVKRYRRFALHTIWESKFG